MIARTARVPLIVYGHRDCLTALMLATLLTERQIAYEWRDVQAGAAQYQDHLRQLAGGYLSVPTVIFPDGSVLVERPQEVLDKLGLRRLGFFAQVRLGVAALRRRNAACC
jgi:glutaredoxin